VLDQGKQGRTTCRPLPRWGRHQQPEPPHAAPASGPEITLARSSFGKYQLIANLGSGGMADVFLAVAKGPAGFNKLVVIKCLRKGGMDEDTGDDSRLADREFVDMFLEEARLAARLNHPNIVQTNEVGEDAGDYFIAMEYLDGQSLNRVISRSWKREGLPLPIAIHCIAEALSALDHAHNLKDFDGRQLEIVHRDASPHNVFVTYEGQTKLVDFGIAKAATRGFETKTGIVKGKLPYMAPEQARCADVDRRADVFSIGVMLWEVIAKRRMWIGIPEIQVLQKLVAEPPPRLVEFAPDTPEDLLAIVDKATAFDPAERYLSADEMRVDLLAWAKKHDQMCTQKDVGRFVGDLFADKRKLVAGIIEAQFAQIRAGQSVDLRTLDPMAATGSVPHSNPPGNPLASSHPRVEGDASQPSHSSQIHPQSAGSGGLVSVPAVAANTQASRKSMWIGRGGLGIAAVAVAVMVATRNGNAKPNVPSEEPTTRSATTAAAPTSTTPSAPATATQADAASAKPTADLVKVTIHAAPDSAKIFIDGAEVTGNPFTGTFPKDGASHNVRVEADGFETKKALVSFDQDRLEEYALNRPGRPPVAITPLPARTPDPTPSATEPPATTTPTASSTGPKKPPTRDLNHDDPWKK